MSAGDFEGALAQAEAARHLGPIVDWIERAQGTISAAQLAVLRELPYGDDNLDMLARARNHYDELRYRYEIVDSEKRITLLLERWPTLSRHDVEKHIVRGNGGKRTTRIKARAKELRRIENLRDSSEITDS